jgi:flavodoxin I
MKKVIIIYETETGNTEAIAKILDQELSAAGLDVKSKRISKANDEGIDLIRAVNAADAVIIGSPTHYSRILDSVLEFLTEMGRASYTGRSDFSTKIGAAFGSYSWSLSGEGVPLITDILKDKLKMKVIEPGLSIKGKPGEDTVEICKAFATLLTEKVVGGF